MTPHAIAPATFVILATRWIGEPLSGAVPYWEIDVATDLDPHAPRRTLLTRDDVLIGLALDLEGSDTPVTLTWHRARRRQQLVLDALEEVLQ